MFRSLFIVYCAIVLAVHILCFVKQNDVTRDFSFTSNLLIKKTREIFILLEIKWCNTICFYFHCISVPRFQWHGEILIPDCSSIRPSDHSPSISHSASVYLKRPVGFHIKLLYLDTLCPKEDHNLNLRSKVKVINFYILPH